MASAQLHAVEPLCCRVQSLEKPARLIAQRPTRIGQAAPASFQETHLIGQANDPPRTGAQSVKSRQPPRAALGCEDSIAFIRTANKFRRSGARNFFAQQ